MAAALLPLLLLAVLRLNDRGLRPALWLSLILAAAWLTNAPAAVMIPYSAAGLAVLTAVINRSWRPIVGAALAVILGAGLASFYLIPAIYEEKWVNIREVLAPGVRPQDNFLFTTIADAEHNQFNRMVSVVAAVEIVAIVGVVWLSRRWRAQQPTAWTPLVIGGAGASLLMLWPTN